MNFKQIRHHRTVDLDTYLGYSCCNVFDGKNRIRAEDVLFDKLLADKYDKFLNKSSLLRSLKQVFKTDNLENEFGPVNLNELKITDFKQTNYLGLLSDLEKYWEDENWGEDLELFKVNFYEALNFVNDYNLSNRKYYYINLETARNEIFIDKDCWTYFIGIFSLDKKNSNVITMCFGND